MEAGMNFANHGDIALRILIDNLRIARHPASEYDKVYNRGYVDAIALCMRPSPALLEEARAEVDALRLDKPVRPYERHEYRLRQF
jgi:hypothetical protein